MKKFFLALFHLCLLIVFALAGALYLAQAGGGNAAFSSYISYNTGAYVWAILLCVLLPLLLLGGCSLLFRHQHRSWLPWIGLVGLCWEAPIFFSTYSVFPENSYPVVPSVIAIVIAILCACATLVEGVKVFRTQN
jgi:hypothetical protein